MSLTEFAARNTGLKYGRIIQEPQAGWSRHSRRMVPIGTENKDQWVKIVCLGARKSTGRDCPSRRNHAQERIVFDRLRSLSLWAGDFEWCALL